jgi:hypothetical protein
MDDEIKVECTWGDGPDVILKIGGKLHDLTSEQAKNLARQLEMAAANADHLDNICESYDAQADQITQV